MSKDELMPIKEFEMIYATAIQLVKSSSKMFDLCMDMTAISKELYVEVIRMHNASCDFIEAYKKYLFKEEN